MKKHRETALLPPGEAEERKGAEKRRLTGSLPAKVAAFLLLMVMALVTVGSVIGAVIFADQGLYTTDIQAYKNINFEGFAFADARAILETLEDAGEREAEAYCGGKNIRDAAVWGESGALVWRLGADRSDEDAYWFHLSFQGKPYTVQLLLDKSFPVDDNYALANRLIDWAYALRYWIYVIAAAAVILFVVCFVFLMQASGHHSGEEGVRPGWGTWIPLDLLTIGGGVGGFLLAELAIEAAMYSTSSDLLTILLLAACGVFVLAAVTGWCMSVALRIKLGGWWRNTVICHVLRFLLKALKKLRRGLERLARGFRAVAGKLPLVWKTAVIFGGLSLLELMWILLCWWETDVLLMLWVVEKLLLFPAVLCCALMLRKLQRGGQALAAGDLSYQVDTSRLIWDFRRHGEDLNSIADGMNRAVEQRMKSERLKTELITNVSHDIKTPLTSIINYADLIGREPCENEKIQEYAAVLHRQSERLKKLIEDLVEASKASTGNLEVVLAPCEAGVLLTQAAGEYGQRLAAKELELVVRQPEHPVRIMADGRRLWRVFDNLMNNICKYAHSGTRVYLTLEEQAGQAVISFKNTSHSPLDISADELMERFVRGDAARNTEGNGLGLSIARSLTELQQGTLTLTVDGDLFKVVLRFPIVE